MATPTSITLTVTVDFDQELSTAELANLGSEIVFDVSRAAMITVSKTGRHSETPLTGNVKVRNAVETLEDGETSNDFYFSRDSGYLIEAGSKLPA